MIVSGRRDFLQRSLGAALGLALPARGEAAGPAPGRVVDGRYFGLHMVWPVSEPYIQNAPPVPVGAWRAMLPELHWFSLEPSKGAWHFDKLDIALRLMEKLGVDVLLTLGETPLWASSRPDRKGPYRYGQLAPPRDIGDWERYVRAVATRYRGRIRCYELWNEPEVREVDGDRAYFSAGQLVELGQTAYRIIKEIDADALLTTPSMVGGEQGIARMDAYLGAGGRACADVVAFHYYGLPEQIAPYHAGLLRVMLRHGIAHLPVWNTEFGYLIEDPTARNTHPLIGGSFARVLPADEAAIWLGRSLIIAASLGIQRFYWYMWDGKDMGLTTWVGRRQNAAGVAYGTVARWLLGKHVGAQQSIGNVAFFPLVAPGGGAAEWLVWTRDYRSQRWHPPAQWKVDAAQFLDGHRSALPESDGLELTGAPVLLGRSA